MIIGFRPLSPPLRHLVLRLHLSRLVLLSMLRPLKGLGCDLEV